jgi:hypothetical protein
MYVIGHCTMQIAIAVSFALYMLSILILCNGSIFRVYGVRLRTLRISMLKYSSHLKEQPVVGGPVSLLWAAPWCINENSSLELL